ncbi:acyltransferase-like protein At3g26840, chloroplastic isoform X3 [Citrus clementina]|uniref:acyltransferase-like protein At3g26840, chloroplastic isoform X3 n=1 Tax=Citrus clementina TaxID=85681 RepID=UPI000CECE8F0|nr:acyltransferase-like protein At3g26840, chloroplastic isoform X3 [Citrus x clementina]
MATTAGACFFAAGSFQAFHPSPRRVAATTKTTARFAEMNVEGTRKGLRDYFEESKVMIKSDGGPPRWFSPLETGARSHDSPLLLFLPGIDGVGLGLVRHHYSLGKIFDIWCLHIPVKDRTSFAGLIKLVEKTVRSEVKHSPNRPIYLVGESLGACIALAVASCNPDVDLVLILANPATSFSKSQLQTVLPLLEVIPDHFHLSLRYVLSSMTGDLLKRVSGILVRGQTLQETVGGLCQDSVALPLYLSLQVLTDILPQETLIWKLQMLKTASTFVNARLHAVEAQTLILSSYIEQMFSPVTLSTLEDGMIVRGLGGIPMEGPVLIVGYHMLLGIELIPLVCQFFIQRKIVLRGMAHPMLFVKLKDGRLLDSFPFDQIGIFGGVPVSAVNFYKLLSLKSHILLYPGGIREALHRKGEEYKLFWPEQSEFIRMAARFGAKIVPFGVVGEDDFGDVLLDYDDQIKIPFMKSIIEEFTNSVGNLRTETRGEVANQDLHFPMFLPKVPGRFYYYFGKPIETEGRKQELRDKGKAHELYLQVQDEIKKNIAFLKEKREKDPYRSVLSRLAYQAAHGVTSEIPTFEI